MDGENNGKPYEQMDDLGVPLFLETPISQKCQVPLSGISNFLDASENVLTIRQKNLQRRIWRKQKQPPQSAILLENLLKPNDSLQHFFS